ncbi:MULTISPECIES: UxaA family hydrolase [unclassified Beijerinckia]|uniref:UxaA family hydrolase n=1 Tax=unclassified Beijerinckia TaxID=2638183 RepID=UPI00089C6AA7|nr:MULTISPECIES: UxaA family hydrolase [unclassified Beijerinckia]MDH7798958.1 altronate dehydratase small subunit [Beijerinckia sp. GAS462]SED85917.1 altronate dehydratase small subunit [Beijerinckia sp. 28-YEA-48]
MDRVLKIDPQDNVATCLAEFAAGAEIEIVDASGQLQVRLRSAIPFGHKFALTNISAGAPVLKYGVVVGRATQAIAAGEHVHLHNIESNRGRGDRS